MYFYKDSNNLFHINQSILPPGNYILNIFNFESVVSVESADTHLQTMPSIEVINLQKEDNSFYVSIAELLSLNAEFFSIALESTDTSGFKTTSKNNTFTPAIVFDVDEKYYNQYIQSGALTISLDSNTNGPASYVYLSILTDGNNITFPSNWRGIINEYDNSSALFGLIIFYDGVDYQYHLYKIVDLIGPKIISYDANGLNSYVNINFDEGVYGADDAITPLTLTDLDITNFVSGAATAISILSITNTSGEALTGGESIIRCNLSITGIPDGTETFEIQPINDTSIYDINGNASLVSETSGTITLLEASFLTFNISNLTDLVQSAQKFTAQTAAWGNYGLADDSFTSDKAVECDILDVNVDNCMLGFRDDNINTNFLGGYDFYVMQRSGDYKYGFNSQGAASSSGIVPQNGDKMRLRRQGSSVFAEYYRGASWNLIHDFTLDQSISGITYVQISATNINDEINNVKFSI